MLNRILKGVLTAVFLVVTAIGTMVLVVHQENKSEEEESNDDFDPDSKMITRNKLKTDEEKEDSIQRVGDFKEKQHEKKMKEKEKSRKLDKIAKEKAEKERQKELEKQRKLAEEKKRKEEEEKRILAEAKKREEKAQKRVEEEKRKREVVQQQEKTEEKKEKVVENENKTTENKVAEEKEERSQLVSRGGGYKSTYNLTHYSAFCPTCAPYGGITASGYDISNTIYYKGYRIVAMPSNIPLYTKVRLHYSNGEKIDAIVLDRGGDIVGKRADLLVNSTEEAYRLGRFNVEIEILN